MADINLLPDAKSKGLTFGSRFPVRRIVQSLILLLGIGVVLYAGSFLFVFVEDRMVTQSNDSTRKEIEALEPTEQKFTLLRDRIKKADKILSSPGASDEARSFSEIQKRIPPGTSLEKVDLQPTGMTITAKVDSSSGISEFLRSLIGLGQFKQIELASLTFSPKDRYIMEITIVNTK